MKKYSFFVFEPEYHQFLTKIRDLGVIHVKKRNDTSEVARFQQNAIDQEAVKSLQRRLSRVRTSNKLPDELTPELLPHRELPQEVLTDYTAYTEVIKTLDREIDEKEHQLLDVLAKLQQLEPWGDFDPTLIQELKTAGYHFHFWQIPTQLYKEEWEEAYNALPTSVSGRHQLFVTVTQSPKSPTLPNAEEVKLPPESISQLRVEEETLQAELKELRETLIFLAYNNHILTSELVRLQNIYNFDHASYQGERMFDDKLVVLEGWVPEAQASEMEQTLEAEDFAYVPLEIGENEDVPVKLTNSRFARVFEPIVKMFSIPNYHEIDPTPYIAPFFLLFFGICFGDSGYGLLVLLVTTLLKPKVDESLKPIVELGQWLGLSGLVIGFFSGSFFGIELVKVPFLANIREFFISSDNMMIISLALGFVHVIFGKYVAAYKKHRQKGLRHSLSAYAWPTIILLGGVMLLLPRLEVTLPQWAEYALLGVVGISVLLVVFYNSPGKNIFLNIGSSLWDTFNNASGLIGDVLSYIRLFAIGLTGAVLGQVFNSLAATATSGLPIVAAIPIGAIILLLGHAINFGLTTIGAIVHPVRLIYVEYFNNSEFEGGGTEYDPLRRLEVEKK